MPDTFPAGNEDTLMGGRIYDQENDGKIPTCSRVIFSFVFYRETAFSIQILFFHAAVQRKCRTLRASTKMTMIERAVVAVAMLEDYRL
jgi:hypothetical protein